MKQTFRAAGTGARAAVFMCALFFAGNGRGAAMDWPTEDGVLVRNFGSPRAGRPSLGSVFESAGAVRSVEDGAIVFVHDPALNASRVPSPLGYWAAVDHGDGLLSMYGKLDAGQPVPDIETVNRGRVIAAAERQPAARSGAAATARFYFSFYDKKERRWLNPAMIITPLADTVPPVIFEVELRDENGERRNPALGRRLAQGNYAVMVDAADRQSTARPQTLAPHRIICVVNGMEASALTFETWAARDGILMAARNGLVPARNVYAASPLLEAGRLWLTRGQTALEIIVQDAAGNTRSALYRLQIE